MTTKILQQMIPGHIREVAADIPRYRQSVDSAKYVDTGLEVVRYDVDMRTEDVLTDLDRKGLRPACVEELMAYSAKRPGADRIVALGTCWTVGGCAHSPTIGVFSGDPYVGLFKHGRAGFYAKMYGFLAAKK